MGYDTANFVLNMARVRLKDQIPTLEAISGNLLDRSQPFTQQAFNSAWRKCQAWLAEKGYSRVTDEVIIESIPVVASADPASQCWIGWSGCFNGVATAQTPALPAALSHPLKVWERWHGQSAQFADPPMEKILDGLPTVRKTTRIGYWEWRNDRIYHPGSQRLEDLRIRYAKLLDDMTDVDVNPGENQVVGAWYEQTVPIMRVADGLAWYICAEMAPDPVAAEAFVANAKEALCQVFNLDVRADQRVNIRRQPRSARRRWY